jgi:hypothetical protein
MENDGHEKGLDLKNLKKQDNSLAYEELKLKYWDRI